MAAEYRVGVGRSAVDPTFLKRVNMMGFNVETQISDFAPEPMFCRAFMIGTLDSASMLAIVVADLWSCTEALQREVLNRVARMPELQLTETNLMITGTHTHSGPAGISDQKLYNHMTGGYRLHISAAYVDCIVRALLQASKGLTDGQVLFNEAADDDMLGGNRSLVAYNANPETERKRYEATVDGKLTSLELRSMDRAIGMVVWHPLHSTALGQTNKRISGDLSGTAAQMLEETWERTHGGATFIAAFATANAGDVSPNMVGRDNMTRPGRRGRSMTDERGNMKWYAERLKEIACGLLEDKKGTRVELTGPLKSVMKRVDMSNLELEDGDKALAEGEERRRRATYTGAIGLSTFAGSIEDGVAGLGLREGIRDDAMQVTERIMQGILISGSCRMSGQDILTYLGIAAASAAGAAILAVTVVAGTVVGLPLAAVIAVLGPTVGAPVFLILKDMLSLKAEPLTDLSDDEKEGHLPKPITVRTKGLAPAMLPLQILRIGQFALAGVPGELTTMAGRRLRSALAGKFRSEGTPVGGAVEHVGLACYANAYSQYITTKEEYEMQHYEGASTLYGPHTLDGYIQEFQKLTPELGS